MTPAAGPAGATLTFTGVHLARWRGRVLVGDRPVLPGQQLTGDTFTAVVPDDLLPGFYEVRVDVASLHRRTFLYEVTP
jgi:hypothetical protein